MLQRHLAADEAETLGGSGIGPGGIEADLVAHGAAEQGVDRLVTQLTEEVPQGEIDATDRVEHDSLAPVMQGRQEHLVPDPLDVRHRGALHEAGEVLLDDPGTDVTARGDPHTHRPVVGFDLDQQRSEYVEPERSAAGPVLRVAGHRRGDMIVDPM